LWVEQEKKHPIPFIMIPFKGQKQANDVTTLLLCVCVCVCVCVSVSPFYSPEPVDLLHLKLLLSILFMRFQLRARTIYKYVFCYLMVY
jgi:hypothetical protein